MQRKFFERIDFFAQAGLVTIFWLSMILGGETTIGLFFFALWIWQLYLAFYHAVRGGKGDILYLAAAALILTLWGLLELNPIEAIDNDYFVVATFAFPFWQLYLSYQRKQAAAQLTNQPTKSATLNELESDLQRMEAGDFERDTSCDEKPIQDPTL